MITNPPIDKLSEKANNKYALCCVVAKRAKDLNKSEDLPQNEKPISFAAKEFNDGVTEIRK